MVKIALAGGSGDVGREVTDALVATGRHEILLLSRKDAPASGTVPGVSWAKANYEDQDQLTDILRGVDTVLSFIDARLDEGNVGQKNLIQAAIRAGVRRFAPSEWAAATIDHNMPWYAGKAVIREYLAELNKDKKVIEYTLFQPGLFLNYLTYPHQSTKHVAQLETPFDFANRRALILDGSEKARVTLTTVEDVANAVVRAVEFEGTWPVVGGIRGNDLSLEQLIALGEKIRGGPFSVEKLKLEDLKAGVIKASWVPELKHPSLTAEEAETLVQMFTSGILLGISNGTLGVSDEWNRLLPDYKFTDAEAFLTEAWRGKP